MSVAAFREIIDVQASLLRAYESSFYAIWGSGGPLQQWIDGYTQHLEEDSIGAPAERLVVTGEQVSQFAGEVPNSQGLFQDDIPAGAFDAILTALTAGETP